EARTEMRTWPAPRTGLATSATSSAAISPSDRQSTARMRFLQIDLFVTFRRLSRFCLWCFGFAMQRGGRHRLQLPPQQLARGRLRQGLAQVQPVGNLVARQSLAAMVEERVFRYGRIDARNHIGDDDLASNGI